MVEDTLEPAADDGVVVEEVGVEPTRPSARPDEAARVHLYGETLLTASSILAGFALSGLFALVDIGAEGIATLAASIEMKASPLAFPIGYYSMLFSTLCFLGVLVTVVNGRLHGRGAGRRVRATLRATNTVVFGLGLSSLFCATISVSIPTPTGILLGFGGGGAIALSLFLRALILR